MEPTIAVGPHASSSLDLDAAPLPAPAPPPVSPCSTQRIFLSVRLCRMATVFVWNCTNASHSHGLRISVSPLPSSVLEGFGDAQGTLSRPCSHLPQHKSLILAVLLH